VIFPPLKQRIRDLGERLESHRKRQQEQHPGLTLTGIYNVLEKLRSDETMDHSKSNIQNSTFPSWPDRLPDQVAILRKLIGGYDKSVVTPYDAESLSALFGRKNKKRTDQIKGILETLKGLGQL